MKGNVSKTKNGVGPRGYSGLLPKVVADVTSGQLTLAANTYTVINELTAGITLNLSSAFENYDNEWDIEITQNATVQNIVLPIVRWGLGIAPTFAANTITILRLYYVGETLCGEWVTV